MVFNFLRGLLRLGVIPCRRRVAFAVNLYVVVAGLTFPRAARAFTAGSEVLPIDGIRGEVVVSLNLNAVVAFRQNSPFPSRFSHGSILMRNQGQYAQAWSAVLAGVTRPDYAGPPHSEMTATPYSTFAIGVEGGGPSAASAPGTGQACGGGSLSVVLDWSAWRRPRFSGRVRACVITASSRIRSILVTFHVGTEPSVGSDLRPLPELGEKSGVRAGDRRRSARESGALVHLPRNTRSHSIPVDHQGSRPAL